VKDGLQIGVEACVEDIIAQEMQPAIGGDVARPRYSTATVVYHMEWAARCIILPYLDDGEEGIGTGVRVRHLHPAPVGAAVKARAVCTSVEGNVVRCDVQVWCEEQLLGEGQVEQRIVPRRMLHERFPEFWAHDDLEDA